jgi:hypothetical protein
MSLDRRIERRPQRPQVGGRAGRAEPDPFGRHVQRGPQHHVRAGDGGVPLDGGDAEVGQHDAAVVGQQHVGRLDVAVQHPGPLRGVQGGQQFQADARDAAGRERAVLADDLLQ